MYCFSVKLYNLTAIIHSYAVYSEIDRGFLQTHARGILCGYGRHLSYDGVQVDKVCSDVGTSLPSLRCEVAYFFSR